MKILTVNRNYFVTGGPEKYMFSLVENMPQHQFIPFCVDLEQNRETPYQKYFVAPPSGSGGTYYKEFRMSPAQKATYALNSIYHRDARHRLERLIQEERPNLALFLNAVYFSDSIIDACRKHKVPIIWRLSDFHKVCANYMLYRDGHVCEDCIEHGLSRALRNRCGGYQRSLGAALTKIAGMWLSRARNVYDDVSYFVAPSGFLRRKMIEAGFTPKKVVHIPTFVDAEAVLPTPYPNTPHILYCGRLTPEKGVSVLVEAVHMMRNKDVRLTVTGDTSGDYGQKIVNSVPPESRSRVDFIGFRNQKELATAYDEHSLVVVPSLSYDNLPNVVLEAMAHERPVIVSRLGSLAETVEDGKTGCHFESNNPRDLALKLDYLVDNPDVGRVMGKNARSFVLRVHSLRTHLGKIGALFEEVAA
jgi:glycosyltransferase involved in cell wall biosynthesis